MKNFFIAVILLILVSAFVHAQIFTLGDSTTGAHLNLSDSTVGITSYASEDLNGDGYKDFVYGVPNENNTYSNSGSVHIIWGSPSNVDKKDFSDSSVTLYGNFTGYGFGQSIGIGDVNNDGQKDLVIGCPFCFGAIDGSVYVVYNNKIPLSGSHDIENGCSGNKCYNLRFDGKYCVNPPSCTSSYPTYLGLDTVVGDVTGDNIDDIVSGSSSCQRGSDSGCSYVFAGNASRPDGVYTIFNTSTREYSFMYKSSSIFQTCSPQAIGDVNCDGKKDLLFGCPHTYYHALPSEFGYNIGSVYICYSNSTISGDHLITDCDAVIHPNATTLKNTQFGAQVITEDVNNDSCDDIIGVASTGNPYASFVAILHGQNFSGEYEIANISYTLPFGTIGQLNIQDYNNSRYSFLSLVPSRIGMLSVDLQIPYNYFDTSSYPTTTIGAILGSHNNNKEVVDINGDHQPDALMSETGKAYFLLGNYPPACYENWTAQYSNSSCEADYIAQTKYYVDQNTCNTSNLLPPDNGSTTLINCAPMFILGGTPEGSHVQDFIDLTITNTSNTDNATVTCLKCSVCSVVGQQSCTTFPCNLNFGNLVDGHYKLNITVRNGNNEVTTLREYNITNHYYSSPDLPLITGDIIGTVGAAFVNNIGWLLSFLFLFLILMLLKWMLSKR